MALGVSLMDIEHLDNSINIHKRGSLLQEFEHKKEVMAIKNTIRFCDGLQMAFASIMNNKNAKVYDKWRRKQMRLMNKLLGIKNRTLWDGINKKSKRI
jgi:hypothetical protein